jgi:hypothetical protein
MVSDPLRKLDRDNADPEMLLAIKDASATAFGGALPHIIPDVMYPDAILVGSATVSTVIFSFLCI